MAEEETPGAVTGSGDAEDPPAVPSGTAASDGAGRSEAGAVAAAMRFATASQAWVYVTDADIEAAARAVVAPSSQERLVDEVVDDVRLLRDQVQEAKGTVWHVVSPLATKVDSHGESRSVVRVWVSRDRPATRPQREVGLAGGRRRRTARAGSRSGDIEWFDGSLLGLRKFTSSQLLDAGFNIATVAERQGHTPQVLAAHYTKSRSSADRKAATHLGRLVHQRQDGPDPPTSGLAGL